MPTVMGEHIEIVDAGVQTQNPNDGQSEKKTYSFGE
jgi:hypothetical protein